MALMVCGGFLAHRFKKYENNEPTDTCVRCGVEMHSLRRGRVTQTKFAIGDRVKPSSYGIERNIFTRNPDRKGTVTGLLLYRECVNVVFDGNKSQVSVHVDFLDIVEGGE